MGEVTWLVIKVLCGYLVAAFVMLVFVVMLIVALTFGHAHASAYPHFDLIHDDGRFAGSPLRDWFNGLASQNGPCCSNADGISIQDPDIDTVEGRWEVHICAHFQEQREGWATCKEKAWLPVPDEALVKEPNRYGPAVVWPYPNGKDETQVRCFLPGSGV
jgi:hypothetical protein